MKRHIASIVIGLSALIAATGCQTTGGQVSPQTPYADSQNNAGNPIVDGAAERAERRADRAARRADRKIDSGIDKAIDNVFDRLPW